MKMSRRFGILLGLYFALSTIVQAEDWPQFRGDNASGVSKSTKSLPTTFSQTENLLWSARVGDGVSSPIIVQGKVYCTAMISEQKFGVFAFDAVSGKQLWLSEHDTGKLPRITPPNSHASATPACDGKRVYVHFSTLGLLALDCNSGQLVWKRELPLPAYLMDWGAGSSPIVYKDMVIFNQDDDLAPALFAVDSATGEIRWRTDRKDMLAGYAIPVLCQVGDRTDIVIAGCGKLKGYDPSNGQEIWHAKTLLRTVMTSPVVRDGLIYTSVQSYGDDSRRLKSALLEWLDTNQDGALARDEVPKEFWERFDLSDKNKDKSLTGEELDTAFQSTDNMVGGGTTIQAVRGGGTGDVTSTHVVWNLQNRSPSNLSSPVVVGDQLFVVKKGGISSSFDAATGKTHWEIARIKNIGEYFGSPTAGDGKIYVPGDNGFVVVLKQGPKLEFLAKNDIGENCPTCPAIADGRLYIRGRETLFCFSEEAK